MSIEFIGMIGTENRSEAMGGAGLISGHADGDFVAKFARAHEDGGFDRVLIGYGSTSVDGFTVAAHAAAHTSKLGFLLAHRPGFVAPTLAARKLATLDQFTRGRMAVHIITIGDDVEAQKDGDWFDKDTRYARSEEYIDILRKTWTSTRPFDHEGKFYRSKASYSEVKPYNGSSIPVFFGGSSEAAIQVGARQADVWAMWGEPLAPTKAQIQRVRALAAEHGRDLGISVSFRPILAATEDKAWERAADLLERVKANYAGRPPRNVKNAGSQRLLEFAKDGDILDERLFTAIAKVTGAAGNSTALVGTPDQVAEAMLAYYDIGVTTLLIRGFDPLQDAIDYGRDLLPIVRAEVAKRERQLAAV